MSTFLSLLSAVLLALTFPKPNFASLAWVALIPWFCALTRQKNIWQASILSYIVGLTFFSITLYWVNYVSSLGFSVLILYLAFYPLCFGMVFYLLQKLSRVSQLLCIPCAWVALEYVRSHLMSGFGWALFGYSQYSVLPIIQISDITGAYGVSFFIVLVNVGIWQIVESVLEIRDYKLQFTAHKHNFGKKVAFSVICVLLSVCAILSYGYFRLSQRPEGEKISVAVVQGNIPQEQKWDPRFRDFILKRYFYLTKEAVHEHPDIIIWPETSVPGFLEVEADLLETITTLSKEVSPALLLVGAPQQAADYQVYNSATLLAQGKTMQRYDKLHLVPFGEFIPWPEFFSRFSFAGLIGNFIPGQTYTVFNLISGVKASALICFEDVFAHLVRRFVSRGARLLINMTNDAWFVDSAEPYQHLQASVFRAIENRVNVVRSANTGVSCFIDHRGKILSRVSDYLGRDVLVAGKKTQEIEIISTHSFYTRYGDIFAWICIVGSCGALIKRRFGT